MYIEESINKRLSYHDRKLKDYNHNDLKQLAFDFTPYYNDYNPPISKECHSIYKKQDGSLIVKITKYRPIQDSYHRRSPGYVNGYGHKLVDVYEQYKFKI